MGIKMPDVPESEQTPLVRQLLEIIQQQQERIEALCAEIAQMKGLSPKPKIAPSKLEHAPFRCATPLPTRNGRFRQALQDR